MNTPDIGAITSALLVFSIIAIVVFVVSKQPATKEKTKSERYTAAIELLKGGNAAEIAAREKVSVEELEKWKDDFLESALVFAKNMNSYNERENEIHWFETVCEKHIGSDWKKITNYDKRNG